MVEDNKHIFFSHVLDPMRLTYVAFILLLAPMTFAQCQETVIVGNISANFLSENYIERNGQTVLQLMVSVDAGSMSPNLNIGDLVVVENISKNDIITYAEAELTGYKSFTLPGDVILYRPYGKEILTNLDQCQMLGNSSDRDKATPIMHRAMRWVDKGEPMWEGGPVAPFSGYITKGDHNEVIDQMAGQIFGTANISYVETHGGEIANVGSDIYLDKKTGLLIYTTANGTFVGDGISFLSPVKKEWIIGIVRAKIPYGCDWTKLSISGVPLTDCSKGQSSSPMSDRVPEDLFVFHGFGACQGEEGRTEVSIDANGQGLYEKGSGGLKLEDEQKFENEIFRKTFILNETELLDLLDDIEKGGFYDLNDSYDNPEVDDGDCEGIAITKNNITKSVGVSNMEEPKAYEMAAKIIIDMAENKTRSEP
jgi:signal peptidase